VFSPFSIESTHTATQFQRRGKKNNFCTAYFRKMDIQDVLLIRVYVEEEQSTIIQVNVNGLASLTSKMFQKRQADY
jgi:ribosomal protein S18